LSLRNAAQHGEARVIQQLLNEYRFNLNGGDSRNSLTASHNAAKFGKVEIVKLLLERRARGDLIDYEGTTPVHSSVGRGCDCLAVLLRHGACFAIRDKQGLTVWHLATQENSFRAFGVLKDYVVDRSPDSPLATKLDHSSMVTTSTSMKQSCTIIRGYYNTKSGDRFTPLRIAKEAGSLGAFRSY